ncbi:dehydrogenase [Luteitalea sp. TBR-22]|uniref:zinc-dependent alcohol dehydrogenase n=1 Tax=Luteitalea sp. TBR-22 TaxID=2802971 RepID=UPI001AF08AAD|nr:alcohol dehydrogenase catalytic domain-containing protein [Luteitalea sp. TBR-22]BCS33020.1 dehydrogenase [Luteitalea sp. TBR-22]
MRAFRVERPGSAGLVDQAMPVPGAGEVLVRVEAVGICGSDLELVKGTRDAAFTRYPVVPGHEWAGVVAETSAAHPHLSAGTPVVVEGHHFCGHCAPCRAGRTHLCANYDEYGFTRDGGYREYVAARADLCHPLQRVDTALAALSEPTACALHAVERSAITPADRVVVIGAGPIGLLAVACAAGCHPARLVVADVRDTTFGVARAVGATDTVCANAPDLAAAVRDVLDGGADVVIEAAGHPLAQVAAADVLARGGRLTVLGIAGSDRTTPFNFDPLVFRDARLEAVFAYPSAVFGRAVRLIDEGRIDPSPLVTHRLPLTQVAGALAMLDARTEPAIKVLLDPRA